MRSRITHRMPLFVALWGLFSTILVPMPLAMVKEPITGLASWYSVEACKYNPDPKCPTANGRSLYELEKEKVLFAAMWDTPFGSRYRVTNTRTGASCVVVILDRGPAKRLHRRIDLSKAAFSQIADIKKGLIEVTIEELK